MVSWFKIYEIVFNILPLSLLIRTSHYQQRYLLYFFCFPPLREKTTNHRYL